MIAISGLAPVKAQDSFPRSALRVSPRLVVSLLAPKGHGSIARPDTPPMVGGAAHAVPPRMGRRSFAPSGAMLRLGSHRIQGRSTAPGYEPMPLPGQSEPAEMWVTPSAPRGDAVRDAPRRHFSGEVETRWCRCPSVPPRNRSRRVTTFAIEDDAERRGRHSHAERGNEFPLEWGHV